MVDRHGNFGPKAQNKPYLEVPIEAVVKPPLLSMHQWYLDFKDDQGGHKDAVSQKMTTYDLCRWNSGPPRKANEPIPPM
jgi:hypothetical protein